ncbi:hypothetical protein PG994_003598 [Apiospora phragmitis]|uniref:BCS1 N-terminal domain-containing protein n=1 Tax=Apiospora phragmitis TaxID=2905665 RepID=A0ABR1W186_9PEZI
MPTPNTDRLSAAAVGSSALAIYILCLLRVTKMIGPRHAQLLLRIQQAMLNVPSLYKLATNHQLALTVPLWFGSAFKLIETLISKYRWIKTFFLKSLTVSITVPASDILNTQIQSWITHKEQPKRRHYNFTATASGRATFDPRTPGKITLEPEYKDIQFWEDWRPFWTIRDTRLSSRHDNGPVSRGHDMTIVTLGYSIAPIMKFFAACQRLAEEKPPKQDDFPVTRVYSIWMDQELPNLVWWSDGERTAKRRLDSAYIDEGVKGELLNKIRLYLNPLWSQMQDVAFAIQLPLYILDLPALANDAQLEALFRDLPSNCFVLLEDIDCVSSTRTGAGVTLSGLLNVFDGSDAVNGRLLLMSSNHPEQLDPALIQPGRVDQKLYLSHISQASAETMFFRIYAKFREPLRQMCRVQKENEEAESLLSPPPPPIVEMTDSELNNQSAPCACQAEMGAMPQVLWIAHPAWDLHAGRAPSLHL